MGAEWNEELIAAIPTNIRKEMEEFELQHTGNGQSILDGFKNGRIFDQRSLQTSTRTACRKRGQKQKRIEFFNFMPEVRPSGRPTCTRIEIDRPSGRSILHEEENLIWSVDRLVDRHFQ